MPAGHVARVFKKAYRLHDKLIRPAQVTVSTAAPTVN
jgi:molecular chaperone GrpE (heat shock protein)